MAGPHHPLDEKAYAEIRSEILARRLLPGTQLVELELAARLGLSRTPIRAALKRLAYEGLVEYRPHRGHIVAQPDPTEVREAFWLRARLEGLAAAEAAGCAAAADLADLDEVIAAEEAACRQRDIAGVLRFSWQFHERIAALSRNRFLLRLITEMNQRTSIYVGLYDFFLSDPPRSPQEHRAIVTALRAGDPEQARLLMERHVLSTLEGLSLPDREQAPDSGK